MKNDRSSREFNTLIVLVGIVVLILALIGVIIDEMSPAPITEPGKPVEAETQVEMAFDRDEPEER